MRVLVTGSRRWADYATIRNAICISGASLIIEGSALGADALAKWAAEDFGIPILTFNAEWSKYGKAAGSIRNQKMLDEGKPDLVLAFPMSDSIGTWDMVNRARKANVPVRIIPSTK